MLKKIDKYEGENTAMREKIGKKEGDYFVGRKFVASY